MASPLTEQREQARGGASAHKSTKQGCCSWWEHHSSIFFNLYIYDSFLFISLLWVLVVACRIFSCGMWTLAGGIWDLVPWPVIWLGPPALGAQSFNHWTTREVLTPLLTYLFFWIVLVMLKPGPLAVKSALNPNHWTAREFPEKSLL